MSSSVKRIELRLIKLKEEIERQKKIKSNERRTKKVNGDLCVLERKLCFINGLIKSYPSSFQEAQDFLAKEQTESNQPNRNRYNFRKRALHKVGKTPPKILKSSKENNNDNEQQDRERLKMFSNNVDSSGTLRLSGPRVVMTPMKQHLKLKKPITIASPEVICLGVLHKPQPELIDLGSPMHH